MRVLAELYQPVEAETPYGGRVVSHEALGVVWLSVGGRRRRERTDGDVTRAVEAISAGARVDPRLIEERMLRFGGADWIIVGVEGDAERPGRVTIEMERGR